MNDEAVLKLLVELGVINAGELDNLREKLKSLETEQKNVGTGAAEAAKGVGELGAESKKGAEIAELLHHNHRALHLIFNQIGKQSAPELGHALGAALRGPLGIAIAAGLAFEHFREKIKEANKELDEFADLASARGKDISESLRAALLEVAYDPKKTIEPIKQMAEALDEYTKKANAAIQTQKQLSRIELEKRSASDAYANSLDELAVKQGKMTKEEADARRLQRALNLEAKESSDKSQESMDDFLNKAKEQGELQKQNIDLEEQIQGILSERKNLGSVQAVISTLPKEVQKQMAASLSTFDLSTAGAAGTIDYLKAQEKINNAFLGSDEAGKQTGLFKKQNEAIVERDKVADELAKQQELLSKFYKGSLQYGVTSEKIAELQEELKSRQSVVDEVNNEIKNQRNANFIIEQKIKEIEKSLALEKEYADLLEKNKKRLAELGFQMETEAPVVKATVDAQKIIQRAKQGKRLVDVATEVTEQFSDHDKKPHDLTVSELRAKLAAQQAEGRALVDLMNSNAGADIEAKKALLKALELIRKRNIELIQTIGK